MLIKEKIEKVLGNYLDINKDYAVHVYIKNGITENIIAKLLVPIDRVTKTEEKKYLLEWKVNDVEWNNLVISYEEIMDCYEEKCEEDGLKISETVVVILKNSMKIEFECYGEWI